MRTASELRVLWLLLILGWSVPAAAQVTAPALNPAAILLNTPTRVTASTHVTLSNVLSVNLIRRNADGTTAVVGQLLDNGQGADLLSGDGVYSGTATVTSTQLGSTGLQVSVALRGVLRRTLSPTTSLSVVDGGSPTRPAIPDSSQAEFDPQTGQTIIANEVIACFAATTTLASVRSIGQMFGGTVIGYLPLLGHCYQFQLPTSGVGVVRAAMTMLLNQPGVTSATADVVREIASAPCATPLLPTCATNSYDLLELDAAHDLSTGAGVVVGVIDTGVDATNSRLNPSPQVPLAPRVVVGPNTTSDPIRADTHGHGTHVAGIIAATAPGATIYAVKACFNGCPATSTHDAIKQAVDAGAKVINLSIAGSAQPHPLDIAAVNYALRSGVTVVAAAGNDGSQSPLGDSPELFAAIPGVLTVGSVDGENTVSSSVTTISPTSNRGAAIGAPGVNITSTYLFELFFSMSGTSQATPFVSGTAALIRALHKGWSNTQVINRILDSAKPLAANPLNMKPNMDLGKGLLDPWLALGAIRVRRLGATPLIDVGLTLRNGNTQVSSDFVTLRPFGTRNDTVRMHVPSAPGTYTFEMRLDAFFTGPVTYTYEVALSDVRASFQSCTAGNPTSVTATTVTGSLFGFGFNPRTLICTITKR